MRKFGGGNPSRRRPMGIRGRVPDAAVIFIAFFKKYTFLGIFWSKFYSKSRVKWLKCFDAPPRPAPRTIRFHLFPPPHYATASCKYSIFKPYYKQYFRCCTELARSQLQTIWRKKCLEPITIDVRI